MEEEIRRYTEVLELLIDRSGWSRREVERRLGWGQGLLSQILAGKRVLKVSQILDLLRTLGIDPLVFYHLAHSPEPLSEGLLAGISQRAGNGTLLGPPALPALPAMTPEEWERRLEEAVRRAMEPRPHPPAPPPEGEEEDGGAG